MVRHPLHDRNNFEMPSLVVWERLLVAGDDLRLATTCFILFRLFQCALSITLLCNLYINFDHDPDLFISTGCIEYSSNYWSWYTSVKIACFVVLVYSLGGVLIEVSIWKISGRGTPVEVEKRRRLVPLCKFLVGPMFVIRSAGFVFAAFSVKYADGYCSCLNNALDINERIESTFHCQYDRGWFHVAKILVISMGVDVLLHIITVWYITKKRLFRWYDKKRPPRERSVREKSWEDTCRRCCQCSSIMTCYIFGGRNLTTAGYADVAIALTDFLHDGGSLDIVASDIAAALICLVNIQKQKQIECKRELLRDSRGLFADAQITTKMLRMLRESKSSNSKKRLSSASKSLLKSMTVCAVDQSYISDIEQGLDDKVESFAVSEGDGAGIQPLATNELEELQKFMSRNKTLEDVSFRLVHDNHRIDFTPRIANVLDNGNEFDRLILGEGARYCRVALAAYSWMLYVWTERCTGCFKLACATSYHAARCNLCHKDENIIGDNCFGWKHSAVMKTLDIDDSDILYANFKNGIGVNPYMIVVDRTWKTIVVAIRGTLSLEDMITDVTISPQCLEQLGEQFGFDGAGEYCHNGILAGARWIYDDLERHKTLDHALSNEFSGFHLRVVGHSLGAGIAAMLGLMLRQKYPSLMCLCFSPPGCVFTPRTAERSKAYACSYVLNNDVVPRLSYESLVNLRNDVIEMVARIKVPKNNVFISHFKPSNENDVCDVIKNQLYNEDMIPDSKFWNDFETYKEQQRDNMTNRRTSDRLGMMYDNMTLPGQIVQMVRTSDNLSNEPCFCCVSCIKCTVCCGMSSDKKMYKVRWSEKEDFAEIFVSPSMLVDHFPHNVARALEYAAKSYDIPLDQGRESILGNLEVKYN